jgi:hypothetical protein
LQRVYKRPNTACQQLDFARLIFKEEYVTMKSKHLLQIFVLFALLFSPLGAQGANASAAAPLDPVVINRNLSYWEGLFIGFVSSGIHEKWQLEFTATHQFVVTANSITGDLVPLLILQDSNGVELTQGSGSLTSTQSAGTYYIHVQPESGSGFYILKRQEIVQTQPSVSTVTSPSSINAGETATVTVSLNNVPSEGYTSAEFICTFDASLVEVGDITVASLFGADPAVAVNGPQGGGFIVAIAGSNGSKATTSGTAFTFMVTGLQAGQTTINCTARVSKGDNVLTDIPSSGSTLTISGTLPTATFTPTPDGSITPEPTVTPDGSTTPEPSSTPDGSITPEPSSTPDGSTTPGPSITPEPSSTLEESLTPTLTSTPVESPTPTFTSTPESSPTPIPDGTVTGQVIAGKPVTVSLFDTSDTFVASVTANPDGTFSLTAPAGTYTIVAEASGTLDALGVLTLTPGGSTAQPSITLLAGDIDGNNVIDQFDAITIGMNYNASSPAAADLNNDGVINVLDLELLAGNYRETGPTLWE